MKPKKGPLCAECPLLKTGFACADREANGAQWSGLSIVSDTPSRDDVRQRVVLSGQPGALLDAALKAVQIDPLMVHFTSAVRCGLPLGQVPLDDAQTKKTVRCCQPILLDNLSRGTTCAVALGNFAWLAVTGLKGVEKYRGCVVRPDEFNTYPAIATLHPAAILFQENRTTWFDMVVSDLRRAFHLAIGRGEVLEPTVVSATAENVCRLLYDSPVVTLDVETDGINALSCKLRTIGVSDGKVALSIPVPGFAQRYTELEWFDIREAFENLFADEDARIVFHNKAFDITVLETYFGVPILAQREDTILLHHCLHPKAPHDLQAVASHYLTVPPWKADFEAPHATLLQVNDKDIEVKERAVQLYLAMHPTEEEGDLNTSSAKWKKCLKATYEGLFDNGGIQEILRERVSNLHYYNAADTFYTHRLFEAMEPQLQLQDAELVYTTDRKISDIALDWYRVGVGIDEEERKRLAVVYRAEVEADYAELNEIAGKNNFNPASVPELVEVLTELNIVPSKLTKKGKISTSKKALFEFREEEFIKTLMDWRERGKLLSTYIEGMGTKLGPDGRLHPQYKLHVTPTGRFSTSPNLQNWPGKMKRLLVPAPGRVIISADFSALELRIVSLLAGQEDQIEVFNHGGDIHWLRASRDYFSSGWEKLTPAQQKQLRKNSKPITFGDIYRAGAATLYENVRKDLPDITLEEVKLLQARKRAAEPQINEWCNYVWEYANKHLELRTPWLGRKRRWPLGNVPDTEAANHPVQGGAGDLMAEATLKWISKLKANGDYHTKVWPCLQIHDDLRAEVLEDYAPEALRSLLECMVSVKSYRSPVTQKLNVMGFVAEGSIGRNHAGYAEDNPLGLVEQTDLNHEVADALFKRIGD